MTRLPATRIAPVGPRATPSGLTRTRVSSVAISVSVRRSWLCRGGGGALRVATIEGASLDRGIRVHAAENDGDDSERGHQERAQGDDDLQRPSDPDPPWITKDQGREHHQHGQDDP